MFFFSLPDLTTPTLLFFLPRFFSPDFEDDDYLISCPEKKQKTCDLLLDIMSMVNWLFLSWKGEDLPKSGKKFKDKYLSTCSFLILRFGFLSPPDEKARSQASQHDYIHSSML